MIYVAGMKLLPVTIVWKVQSMQLLHKISVGSTDRVHNMILLTRKDIEPKYIELKNTAEHAISGSLEVRVGGNPAKSGTPAPLHD